MSLTTRLSLIESLKFSGGAAAWEVFYDTYSRLLLSFARRQGCDEHAAMDVLQETVMVVMRRLPGFEYDSEKGRFRSWLMTIVTNKAREARRRSRADRMISLDEAAEGGGFFQEERLADEIADESASENLERDWRQTLIEEALRRILDDQRTSSNTVGVFRALTLENLPAAEVAARFGIKENAVYQIKHRMVARLQAIMSELESGTLSEEAETC